MTLPLYSLRSNNQYFICSVARNDSLHCYCILTVYSFVFEKKLATIDDDERSENQLQVRLVRTRGKCPIDPYYVSTKNSRVHSQQDTVVAFQSSLTDLTDMTWTSAQRACAEDSSVTGGEGKRLQEQATEQAELSWRLQRYHILKCIGEGASGRVYACEVPYRSSGGATVAMKVVSRAGLSEGSKSLLLSELKVLTTLTTSEFQHGIQLKEAFHDDQNCYFITVSNAFSSSLSL